MTDLVLVEAHSHTMAKRWTLPGPLDVVAEVDAIASRCERLKEKVRGIQVSSRQTLLRV